MATKPIFYTSTNVPNWAWLARYADMDSYPIMNLYIEPEDGREGMISLSSWCLVTDMSHVNNVMHRITPTLSNAHYLYTFGDAVTPLSLSGVTYVNVATDNYTNEEAQRLQGRSWGDWQLGRMAQQSFNDTPPSGLSSLYWFYLNNRITSTMDTSQPVGSRPWMKHITIVIFRQTKSTVTQARGIYDRVVSPIRWIYRLGLPKHTIKIKAVLHGMDIQVTEGSLMKCLFTLHFQALSIMESPSLGFTLNNIPTWYTAQTQ
jgi:hypothetical protein